MKMTVASATFLLDDITQCPDGIDYTMYNRVMMKYENICNLDNTTPVIESIFTYVVTEIEKDVYREVKAKILFENKNIPHEVASEIAEKACSQAIEQLISGLEEEVIEILQTKSLCYKTYSLSRSQKMEYQNTPQIDVILFLKEGDFE